ncbi:NmrA-like family protein [Aspergillus sclerotioniger CBS 115572]|uniref:NmrA-like family protein n=1 Tax=Aspergillus sclerotioniger CBS 115572 TaxID=1450535 RepID=A0A317X2R8_9EURO|nr:NmrA-like family protein [Aspergillus sclerotioniger CBS 115572]PWY91288.1 NmrA-like family protein [Aspergillus sclerotioniger CBS 115572]
MATPIKITLIGATGSIGKIILNALIAHPNFAVTVLSRQDSPATTLPSGITVHKTDYSSASLETLLRGQDVLISAVGAGAFPEQQKFIDAAIRAGVKRFIPSEFSTSSQDDEVLKILPMFQQKRDVINYLKEKEKEGLSWTGIATSGLFDWGLTAGFLGFDLKEHTALIWDGGVTRFTLTNEKQLGDSVASVILHPEETKNRFVYVASVELTQKEALETLEDVTGVKWTVTDTTTETQISEGFAKLGEGKIEGAFALVRATAFGNTPGLKVNYVRDEELANELLGLKMENLRESIERVVKADSN